MGMQRLTSFNEEPLIETLPSLDVYACGVGKIEVIGCCARVWYFTWQGSERVVVAKIVRPLEGMNAETIQRWIKAVRPSVELQ